MSPRYLMLLGVVALGCTHEEASLPCPVRHEGGAAPLRTDLYGDPLPPGAFARLGTVRLRHSSAICSLAYSPDGKTIASGCHDGLVHLWDVKSGKEIARFGERQQQGASFYGESVAFAPDGQTIAVTRREGLQLWNVADGKCREFKDDRPSLFIAFSPDGKLLGVRTSCDVRIWDVATGRKLRSIDHQEEGVVYSEYALAFSPDSKWVASSAKDSILRLWNARTGELVRQFKGHDDRIGIVAFVTEGKSLLSASEDDTLRQWDVSTGKELRRIKVKQGRVHSLAVSPDGKTVVSGGGDGTVRLWELSSGREIRRIPSGSYNGLPVALAPDGKTLAIMGEGLDIRFWDVATGEEVTPMKGVPSDIGHIRFAPDGATLISHSWGHNPRLWDAATGRQRKLSRDLPTHMTCLAVSPAGEMLTIHEGCSTGGWDNRLHYRDLLTGRYLGRFKGRAEAIDHTVFSDDGKYLAMAGEEGIVYFWDRRKGKVIRHFGKEIKKWDNRLIVSLQFAPDSSILIMRRIARISGGGIFADGIGPRVPGETYFWDIVTGKELSRFGAFSPWCQWLVFSQDGTLLATNGDASNYWFHVWDAATGRQLHKLEAKQTAILTAAFSPDGRTVATGHSDGGIWLWETATGSVRRRLEGHTGHVYSLAFSRDGLLLASSSADGTGLVWDLSGR